MVFVADLTAVFVTHNSAGHIGEAIDAALAWTKRIIVIDNASTDSTLDEVRRRPVTLICNDRNAGFASAANQGFLQATSELVLLLNPDVVLADGRDALIAAARPASCGLLTGSDGVVQRGFTIRRLPTAWALSLEVLGMNRLWPSNVANRKWRCVDLDLDKEQDVEQPAGAFLMLRREAWAALGGFDEAFHPVWFEDVDFCRRLRNRGMRIRLIPSVRARHFGAHSIRRMPHNSQQIHWYASLLRYAAKWFTPAGRRGVASAVLVGGALRSAIGFLFRQNRLAGGVYLDVARMAVRTWRSADVAMLGVTGVTADDRRRQTSPSVTIASERERCDY